MVGLWEACSLFDCDGGLSGLTFWGLLGVLFGEWGSGVGCNMDAKINIRVFDCFAIKDIIFV